MLRSGSSGASSAGSSQTTFSFSWSRSVSRRSSLPSHSGTNWAAQTVNSIRSAGLLIIYASLAVPIWQFASFGAWLTLLGASLIGVFLGIGLRLQTFLWLGLATFVLDVVYEMGRVSLDHAMAKWAIMLALGLASSFSWR